MRKCLSLVPQARGFKIASLNIASLLAHIDELRLLMADKNLDVLAINETRLSDLIDDSCIHIQGYDIVRRDRNRNGGGVCLYIRSSINFKTRSNLMSDIYEAIVVEIFKPNSQPFCIVAVYRPPGTEDEFFCYYEDVIKSLDFENKEIIVIGDMNCNYLAESRNSELIHLTEISEVYQLTQIINKPTRITLTSKSLIDLIFTNQESRVVSHGVIDCGINDHCLVYVVRKIAVPTNNRHKYIATRSFKNFNSSFFIQELQSLPWGDIEFLDSPDEMWDVWKQLFTSVANKHAPLKTKRVRHKVSPWLTPDLKGMIIKRNNLKKKAVRSGDLNDWNEYKRLRNKTNNKLRDTKAAYYHKEIENNSGNVREIWKTINDLMSRKIKSNTINELKVNNLSFTEPSEIADELNKHFTEVGSTLASILPQNNCDFKQYLLKTKTNFRLEKISVKSVLETLNCLVTKKAVGLDHISSKLLKVAAPVLAESLCKIFNKSVETGTFPSEWKSAKVFPVHKKDDKSDPNNYRPISVLPAVGKVFERIIYDQLYSYLSRNKILTKHQSGFRSLHSTVTALLDATNEWYFNIDQGNTNVVVFLDLAKAFDTVSHQILLNKLELYGISGPTLDWFKSYLFNRDQVCVVQGYTSEPRKISCGVPQGSILGPLLFLIYINDLPACLKYATARMFADDTTITNSHKSTARLHREVNHDLNNLQNWLLANQLSLNVLKTEYMYFASDYNLSNLGIFVIDPLKIGEQPITRVRSTKSLGVVFDQRLVWEEHVDSLCKRVSSGLAALKQARQYVPQDTLLMIYNAVIKPLFDYCDVVWGNLNKTLMARLQKLQNRAARIITRKGYDVRSADIRKELRWDDLETIRKKHLAVVMYKVVNNKVPSYLINLFEKSNSGYALRESESRLLLPKYNTEFAKSSSFSFIGAKIWNTIPYHIRTAPTLSAFKKQINSLAVI